MDRQGTLCVGLRVDHLDEQVFVRDVAAHVSHEISCALDLATITQPERQDFKAHVADSHLLIMVDGHRREDDIVILVSNSRFPDTVSDAVNRLSGVHSILSPDLGRRLHMPLVSGRYEGRSYAAFGRLETFSTDRIQAALERRLVGRHVVSWLAEVACDSRQEVPEDEFDRFFGQPLDYLIGETNLPNSFREAARRCRSGDMIRRGMAFTVAEHGDFWIGNLLLVRRRLPLHAAARGDFRVIDWGAARRDGYAFIDLVRYCMSTRATTAQTNRGDIERYRKRLDVSPEHVAHHVLASLGRFGLARNEFPKERFLHLAGRVEKFLRIHGYIG